MTAEAATEQTGRWLPEDARLIALVRDSGTDAWAAGVAVGLADMVGRGRGRTYLANVAGAAELDRLLDFGGGPGLTSALTGAATIASIARSRPDEHFVYLPGGDAALPYKGLRRMQKFRRFLARVKEGGGTLLLYLGEEDLSDAAGAGAHQPTLPLDGCIALGDARGCATALGAPLLARVERPAPPPPASVDSGRAAAASERGDGSRTGGDRAGDPLAAADRAGGSGPGSLVRLLIPAAVVALLWVGWSVVGGPDSEEVSRGESGEPAGVTAGAGEAGAAAEPVRAAVPATSEREREFRAPAARYSVLVGSYIRLTDAMNRRAELAEEDGLFYVAPTPVRGRVYYRVLAGAHEDRTDATALMSALVADGRKETEKEWDVRPVRLAYDLGTFAERDAAVAHVERLRAADIPTYVLRDTAETPLYRVYAGAFTSERDAQPLGRRLQEQGEEAELITRSGVAP